LVKLISLHFYLQVKPLQLISKDIIVRFMNKLSRVVQQAQCIKNISGSVVYGTFVHLISSAKSAI